MVHRDLVLKRPKEWYESKVKQISRWAAVLKPPKALKHVKHLLFRLVS